MGRIAKAGSKAFAGAAALALSVAAVAQAQQAQSAQQEAPPAVALGVGMADAPEGAAITMVAPGGTAAALGMRAGDVLLRLGGRAVTEPQVVSEYVRSLNVGDPVSVLVRRDGRTLELTGKALARPPAPPPPPDRSTPVEANELRET